MDDDRESESPLDDLFVEGARYHEPSATERARAAQEFQRQGKAAQRRNRRVRRTVGLRRSAPWVGLVVVVGLVWFLTGRDGGSDDAEDTTAVATAEPEQVQAVLALPGDAPLDSTTHDAITHELALVNQFFERETDGRRIRFAQQNGAVVIEDVALAASAAELRERPDASGLVIDEFRDRMSADRTETLLVFVPVVFEDQVRCGEGSSAGIAVIWVGSCGAQPSSTSSWPNTTAVTIAHELVHTMGAVDACAPNYGRNGHVVDDANDLMYDGEQAPTNTAGDLSLDPGRDDYYGHGRDDCGDVADHPLWDE